MASLKEVRDRIGSVTSTQQITKAMKMVAAAKLRRAQDAIIQMRPYAAKLDGILANVNASMDGSVDNEYGVAREEIKRVLIVVVTSDRGLCGAFNTNVFKGVKALIADKYAQQESAGNVELLCVGTKGEEHFTKRAYNVNKTYAEVLKELTFDNVRKASEFAMDGFKAGDYDAVEIVYNEFKNVATQVIRTEQFLPIVEKEAATSGSDSEVDFIFEPSEEYIVKELIPKSLKIQFYKATLESNASENGARMTAMDKATDNAGELLKSLRLEYNRSRQAAITTEILEIVGGAEALAAAQ